MSKVSTYLQYLYQPTLVLSLNKQGTTQLLQRGTLYSTGLGLSQITSGPAPVPEPQNKSQWQQQKKLFGNGREDKTHFSWAQPTTELPHPTDVMFLTNVAPFYKRNNFERYPKYYHNKEIIYQT